jgi:hypothetical protein
MKLSKESNDSPKPNESLLNKSFKEKRKKHQGNIKYYISSAYDYTVEYDNDLNKDTKTCH